MDENTSNRFWATWPRELELTNRAAWADGEGETVADLERLRAPFPNPERVKREWTTKGGEKRSVTLDYIGHARVTDRLLEVDPWWTWEPLAYTPDGLPLFDLDNGEPVGLWIRLTVCGVTRLGYGSVAPNKAEPVKELIGDAIRNAAMRFGIALELWMKHTDADQASSPSQGRRGGNGGTGPATPPQLGKIRAKAREQDVDEHLTALVAHAWPDTEGSLEALTSQRASFLIDLLVEGGSRLDMALAQALGHASAEPSS